MKEVLLENETHSLNLEKVGSDWWLELQVLETGKVQIIYTKSKEKALSFVKGLTIDQAIYYFSKMNLPLVSMYKPKILGA